MKQVEINELYEPITCVTEHQGNIFVASGNKMFIKRRDDEKFYQMTFVTLEPSITQ